MMKMGEPGTSPHTWQYTSWTSVQMSFPSSHSDALMMMGKPMAAAQTGPDGVDGVETRQLHDEGDVGVFVVVGASGHVHDGVDHADVIGVGPKVLQGGHDHEADDRSSPNTSYTH